MTVRDHANDNHVWHFSDFDFEMADDTVIQCLFLAKLEQDRSVGYGYCFYPALSPNPLPVQLTRHRRYSLEFFKIYCDTLSIEGARSVSDALLQAKGDCILTLGDLSLIHGKFSASDDLLQPRS